MMIYHTFSYSLGKNQSQQWQLWEILTFAEHRKSLVLNLKAPYWLWASQPCRACYTLLILTKSPPLHTKGAGALPRRCQNSWGSEISSYASWRTKPKATHIGNIDAFMFFFLFNFSKPSGQNFLSTLSSIIAQVKYESQDFSPPACGSLTFKWLPAGSQLQLKLDCFPSAFPLKWES